MNDRGDAVFGHGSALWHTTGYRLVKLGELTIHHTDQAFAPLGISSRQFNVLATAASMAAPSQQELSRALGIDPNVMVGVVDDLEKADLVERRRNPEDRRRYVVALTEHGQAVLDDCTALLRRTEEHFFASLSAEEVAALHDMAGRLLSAHPRPSRRP